MTNDRVVHLLEAWTKENKIFLHREESDPRRLYFYRSSEPHETFQVVFEPEKDDSIRIDVHLIESSYEVSIHLVISSRLSEFKNVLTYIEGVMSEWFETAKRGS